jgi:hypothetical protein
LIAIACYSQDAYLDQAFLISELCETRIHHQPDLQATSWANDTHNEPITNLESLKHI